MVNTIKRNKAIKYRIYPTQDQQNFFELTFVACAELWNLMLKDKIEHYKKTKQLLNNTPAQYKDEHPNFKLVDSTALTNVQLHLISAYKLFFQKKKRFPKFKSVDRPPKRYTTTRQSKNSIEIKNNTIRLPKIGYIKAKLHRLPPNNWVIKSATISKTSGGNYYTSILFEYYESQPERILDINNSLGLDYKSDGLYMDSNGNIGSRNKYFKAIYARLSKLKRKLKNKTRGSNNYKKALIQIGKLYERVSNRRKDFLNKLSTSLANTYDIICVESISLKTIASKKNKQRLGLETFDNGYGMFLVMLRRKMEERGKKLIFIDRFYPSSKICSNCGNSYNIKPKNRTYRCPHCGLIIDRDINAAKNIKAEGLRLFKQ